MLTITEEAEGRGSLGKVTAGLELCESGPQGQGRKEVEAEGATTISASAAALIIYHSSSSYKQRKPAIDYTQPPPHPRLILYHLRHGVPNVKPFVYETAFRSSICMHRHSAYSNVPVFNNVKTQSDTESTRLITGYIPLVSDMH